MKRKLQEFLRSVLIIASALMVAGVVLHFSFGTDGIPAVSTVGEELKNDFLGDALATKCQPFSTQLGDKVAVLRIDDVHAYAWGETTRLMINDALDRGIPLTLGIIPKNFSQDPSLVAFHKERECNLEFALHGWNHQIQSDGVTPEFANLSQATATARMTWGVHELDKAFGEQLDMKTWVPPQNVQSTGTAKAALALGFTRLSTEGAGKWDYDASSYAYDTEVVVPAEQVVAECDAQIAEDGKCIIMMHPQVYADGLEHNQTRYEEYYLKLLDDLIADGYTFARFADLDTGE